MSSGATLHSRLRVLVAKTFRAEQLYSSMRNSASARTTSFSEIASDARSGVWLRCHRRLRTALNEALSLSTHTAVAARVQALKNHFESKARESSSVVEQGTSRLIETAKRHEFALVLKLAFELIQHKARAQANAAIADELSEILLSSGRGTIEPDSLNVPVGEELPEFPAVEIEVIKQPAEDNRSGNVIPLRKKLFSGGTRFRS